MVGNYIESSYVLLKKDIEQMKMKENEFGPFMVGKTKNKTWKLHIKEHNSESSYQD